MSLPGITLQPSSPADVFGRFGWALATLDFNMDGIDDLAISSPTRGWNWSTIDIATYTPDYLCVAL